jgi:hypothetical protein
LRSRRDDDHTEGTFGNQRGYIHLDVIDVVINKHPRVIAGIAEEADGFLERGLGVGSICRSDMVDNVSLNTLPRAPIHEECKLEPVSPLDRLWDVVYE